MGIKGLSKIINDASVKKTISSFSGKKAGIDTSIFLYRYMYRAQNDEETTGCILKGFLEQLSILKKNNILPLYIFDGYATAHKRVLEDRKKRRESNVNKMENMKQLIMEHRESLRAASSFNLSGHNESDDEHDEPENKLDEPECDNVDEDTKDSKELDIKLSSNDLDVPVCLIVESDSAESDEIDNVRNLTVKISNLQKTVKTLEKQNRKPSSEHISILKEMFDMLKIPYINSPGESDLVCAQLSDNKIVDIIFSDDTDMLPLRCSTLVTGFNPTKYVDMKEYNLEKVLEHLDLTHEQFIDVCILSGCDYADKVEQIAVKRAYQFIKKYKNIEGVIEHINKHDDLKEKHTYPEDFEEQYQIARQLFLGEHPHIKELIDVGVTSLISNPIDNVWKETIDKESLTMFLNLYNTPEYTKVLHTLCGNTKKSLPKNQQSILTFFNKKSV